jgi:outer membrane protein
MRTITLFALALLLLAGSVSISEAQPSRQITLEQAIDMALQNNTALMQAENNMMIQDANVRSAQADFLPNLNAGFNGQRRTGRQFVQETLQFDDFTTNTMGGSLNSNIIVFDGLRNIQTLRAAQSSRLSAAEMLERQRENVIFSTAVAYLNVILGEELLLIARENLESSSKQLEQIQAQVEVGMSERENLVYKLHQSGMSTEDIERLTEIPESEIKTILTNKS